MKTNILLVLRFASILIYLAQFIYANQTDTYTGVNITSLENINRFPTLQVGRDSSSLYYVNVSVGNPGQTKMLRVNLAQPYTWFLSGFDDSQCNRLHSGCLHDSRYFPAASTSKTVLYGSEIYSAVFFDKNSIGGPLYSDILNFTSLKPSESSFSVTPKTNFSSVLSADYSSSYLSISNFSFLNAKIYGNETVGTLGLSSLGSALYSDIPNRSSSSSFSFLQTLVDTGLISSASYSFWVGADKSGYTSANGNNQLDETTMGKLIFGAVDPLQFLGRLRSFDSIPYLNVTTKKEVTGLPILPMGPVYVSSLTGTSTNLTSVDFLEPAFIDSTKLDSYLPVETIMQIAIQLDAYYLTSIHRWVLPCSTTALNVNFEFSFNGVQIKVPLPDLLMDSNITYSNQPLYFPNSQEACFLNIQEKSLIGYNVIGNGILKNMYLVFENDSGLVAVAQVNETVRNPNQETAKPPINRAVSINPNSETSLSEVSRSSDSLLIRPTIPSVTSYTEIAEITSGYIPYATYRSNEKLANLTMSSKSCNSSELSKYFNRFSVSLSSNTIVTDYRSYYSTARSTESGKSTTSSFVSLSLNTQYYNNLTNDSTYSTANVGSPSINQNNFSLSSIKYPIALIVATFCTMVLL